MLPACLLVLLALPAPCPPHPHRGHTTGRHCAGGVGWQVWDHSKKLERFAKTCCLRKDRAGISSIPPAAYQARFMANLDAITEEVTGGGRISGRISGTGQQDMGGSFSPGPVASSLALHQRVLGGSSSVLDDASAKTVSTAVVKEEEV